MDLMCDDGCSVGSDRRAAMQRGLTAIGAASAAVVVTDDFAGTINRLLRTNSYASERGSGVVAAKTITRASNSTPVIIMNNPVVSDLSAGDLERLSAHEGGHIVLHLSDEEVTGRHHLAATQTDWDLISVGGLAMEEMRIERRLSELGYEPSNWAHLEDLDEAIYAANTEVVLAVVDPASASDASYLQDRIFPVFDRLTKLLAYLAAPIITEAVGLPVDQLDADGRANWNDFVDPTWDARVELYRTLPSLAGKMRDHEWEEALLLGSILETRFLQDIGFELKTTDQGVSFTRVAGSDDLFHTRIERARRQSELRTGPSE